MPENAGRKQRPLPATAFKPGQSGNPAGKPKGARNAVLVALDAIGSEGAEGVLRAMVKAAQDGDVRAGDVILRRVWPERKGRPVTLPLPAIRTAGDLVSGVAAIVAAMASGELTPEEGQVVAGVLEMQRRALETEEFERRLAALEQGRVNLNSRSDP